MAIGVYQADLHALAPHMHVWLNRKQPDWAHESRWSTVPHGIADDMFRYRAAWRVKRISATKQRRRKHRMRGMKQSVPNSVDEYIAAQPEAVRPKLEQVRAAIRRAVPEAVEGIGYGMPVYKLRAVPPYTFQSMHRLGNYASHFFRCHVRSFR